MLNKIKDLFTGNEIVSGNFGIERETLRLDAEGYSSRNRSFRLYLEIRQEIHI